MAIRLSRVRRLTIMALIVGFLGVFLLWPLGHVFRKALSDEHGFTWNYIVSMARDPVQLEAAGRSFLLAGMVTVACLTVALPIAWLFARYRFPGKNLLSAALLIPLILPPFVGAVGMKMVFARSGALSTLLMDLGIVRDPIDWLGAFPLAGVVLMETLHLFPVLYINLVAALANVDPSLEEAAANLGASPGSVFRRVTFPLAWPGFFAGAVLVFIWSFTELGTPLVFGVRKVLPVMIFDAVSEIGTNPVGYAQVVLVLLVSGTGFWISKQLSRRRGDLATLGRLSVSTEEKRLRPRGTFLAYLLIGAILLVAVIPHLSVVLVASGRRWFLTILPQDFTLAFYKQALSSELTRTALRNSLGLAISSSVLNIFIGFGIAWLCVRSRVRGSDFLDAIAMLPIAVPGLVIAFGYMGCFSAAFPKTILDPRFNPMLLLAISYSIRRLPYMVRAAHAGLEQTSPIYEEAGANLGATPFRVVKRITLPLLSANLMAGAILCFAFAMLEVSDSLILAQSEPFYPITKAIYALMDGLENGVNVASALGVWAMALLGAAILWASSILGKRLGQMFRAA